MTKKYIFLLLIIATLQSFISFAQTTVVYDLLESDLTNTLSCGTVRYQNGGSDWGFSWTSTDPRTPTSISVELNYARNCGPSMVNGNVRLNGFNQGSKPTPGIQCSCSPLTAIPVTWTLNPPNYIVGGLNTVLITPVSVSEGIDVLPAYGNAYARVTVTYPSTDPEINIKGLGVLIPNGQETPTVNNNTEFGAVAESSALDHTFSIQNEGVSDLTLTGSPQITVSGSPAFSIYTQPASGMISPGGNEIFTVRFSPTCATLGIQRAIISIPNNDPNKSPYTFTVQGTGSDNIAPTIVVKDITVQLDAMGSVTVNASDFNNGSTDNCAIANYTMSNAVTGFVCGQVAESTNLTMTAAADCTFSNVDFANYGTTAGSCGNYSAGSCRASNSVSIVSSYLIGQNSVVIPPDARFGDPCPGTIKRLTVQASYKPNAASFSASKTYTCADLGKQFVTIAVTDSNGNSSTTTASVTIQDVIKPTVITKNPTIELDASGYVTVQAFQINNGSSDNCGIASMTVSPFIFTCANIGNNTVTLTIKDTSGNTNTAMAVVTVQDTTLPNFGTPAIGIIPDILYYKFDGSGTSIPNLASAPATGSENATIIGGLTQGTSGICGAGSLVGNGGSSSANYVDTNWITDLSSDWTISFKTSNIQFPSGSTRYVFGDINADTFRCFSGGVAGAGNWILRGKTNGPLKDVLVTGGATMAPHTITFVYSQSAGNIKAYLDGVLVKTENQGLLTIKSTSTLKVGAYANSNNVGLPTGGQLDEFGIYNRALSDAEVSQLSSCPTAGTTVSYDNVTLVSSNGTCGAAYTYATPTAYDNCAVTLTQTSGFASGEIFPVGTTTNTFVATDSNGNTTTTSFDVTVQNVTAPTALAQDITIQLDTTGKATITAAQIDNGSSDDCGIASMTVSPSTFDCSNVGPNTVTLTVTDVSGNSSTATATVIIEDKTVPTALAQDITVQLDATGKATITAAQIDNGSSDDCGIASMTVSPSNFDCSNAGSNTVTLTVTDKNGNTSTTTATVTINPSGVNTITRNLDTLTADEPDATAYQWMTYDAGNYANILNETNQSLSVKTAGLYAIDITKNGCTQRSAVYDMTTLGNKDFDYNSKLTVYPNPFNGIISVHIDSNAKMEIYNLLGQIIYAKKIHQGTTQLDLSNQPTGTYLLKITNKNNQLKTVKVIKK